MKGIAFFHKNLIFILLSTIFSFSCTHDTIKIHDESGVLGKTNSPVTVEIKLNSNQINAAKEGRLVLLDPLSGKTIPVQLENKVNNEFSTLIFNMPGGESGLRKFSLKVNKSSVSDEMKIFTDSLSGQVVVEEAGKKELQYNYKTVYEKDVITVENDTYDKPGFSKVDGLYFEEYLKAHPELKKDTSVTTSIYAVPRSDYIHPLYGLDGEMLTRDWPDGGHPHHRGIFWAWPEVEYGKERGDIYALQRVFARPTGNIEFTSGPVYAQLVSENLWMWEDKEPVVREQAVIRVYRAATGSRIIDLTIKMLALKDSVTIATRLTNSYGGLNLRMQTPELQDISYFTDKRSSKPLRTWSDFNGIFKGSKSVSGLMVLQNQDNPEYPGEWREYPNLGWVQPTFPTPNTRYQLSTESELVLRYRLIIHAGGKPSEEISKMYWDAYNANETLH